MQLLGVDVGGTFTDLVFADTKTGQTRIHKVPTTPEDPAIGVLDGITQLIEAQSADFADVDHVFHGTTTATNAILEHDGAVAGMITTAGYRDVIHIGRHQRPQHYSIRQEVPWQDRPLIRRRHRKTVPERLIPPRGEVLEALDEDAVRAAAQQLKQAGVESIAICFLFSYLNPAHENRAKALVLEEFPDCFVSTSSAVSPQFREFERFTTTAMNAFVGPKVRDYIQKLDQRLKSAGLTADLHIMGSNGGVATAAMVAEKPVMTLLSGPAAGVLGGAWAGSLSGRDNLITFDVGGTSADIGIINKGRYAEASARDTSIAGFPLMVPMIDIHTIGAGGGSIAFQDAGGAFRVGPASAGAVPGPAAYGRGGDKPTVTDANVVLGRLDSENFLGGEMQLDLSAARRANAILAEELSLSENEAAEGVLTILNANMANAIRSRTVQKGLDPRDFTLVAFGGGGPLHAADVAASLQVPHVIVPPSPGITSAIGLLTTDIKYESLRTAFQVSDALDLPRIKDDFAAMEKELAAQLATDGIEADAGHYSRAADIRYVGQGYELRVTLPDGDLSDVEIKQLFRDFEAQHQSEYGHIFPDSAIEIVNLRCTGVGDMPKLDKPVIAGGDSIEAALVKTGDCIFRTANGLESFATKFYRRDKLPIESTLTGPAILLQKDTTTLVRPQDSVFVEASGNLLITVGMEPLS